MNCRFDFAWYFSHLGLFIDCVPDIAYMILLASSTFDWDISTLLTHLHSWESIFRLSSGHILKIHNLKCYFCSLSQNPVWHNSPVIDRGPGLYTCLSLYKEALLNLSSSEKSKAFCYLQHCAGCFRADMTALVPNLDTVILKYKNQEEAHISK